MRVLLLVFCCIAVVPVTAPFAMDDIERQIMIENASIPANLSDESVLKFIEDFAVDQNSDQLEKMVLGVSYLRPHLLDSALKTVAQYMPQESKNIVYYVSKYFPERGKEVFVTMSAYLEAQNNTTELAEMQAVNDSIFTEIQNQGLTVETAAGPEDDFEALLKEIGI